MIQLKVYKAIYGTLKNDKNIELHFVNCHTKLPNLHKNIWMVSVYVQNLQQINKNGTEKTLCCTFLIC